MNMAIKILSVCAGGNHVTVERDGVPSIELADDLLAPGTMDTAEGHAFRQYLAGIGISTKEKLQVEAQKGVIDPTASKLVPG